MWLRVKMGELQRDREFRKMWLLFWVSGDDRGTALESRRLKKARHDSQFPPNCSNTDTITVTTHYIWYEFFLQQDISALIKSILPRR